MDGIETGNSDGKETNYIKNGTNDIMKFRLICTYVYITVLVLTSVSFGFLVSFTNFYLNSESSIKNEYISWVMFGLMAQVCFYLYTAFILLENYKKFRINEKLFYRKPTRIVLFFAFMMHPFLWIYINHFFDTPISLQDWSKDFTNIIK